MTDKSTTRRSRSQNRRPADLLAISTGANKVELGEEDLKQVAGGNSASLWDFFVWARGDAPEFKIGVG